MQIGKNTSDISTSKLKMPTLAGNKQLFHPSLPSKDAPYPSFDRKWTVLNRRRWTSKRPFPRRHVAYSLVILISLIGKGKWNNLKWKFKENKMKHEIHDFGTKIHLFFIFMIFSSSLDDLSFRSFGNEEKLVSLLVYCSFQLVATSGIRNSPAATSSISFNSVKLGVNTLRLN